mgnify:CR=1 FL=1
MTHPVGHHDHGHAHHRVALTITTMITINTTMLITTMITTLDGWAVCVIACRRWWAVTPTMPATR